MERMIEDIEYKTLVVVTPADFRRVQRLYGRLAKNLPGQLIFVGNKEVGELAERLRTETATEVTDGEEPITGAAAERIGWIDEDALLSFDEVHALMTERLAPILKGRELPRGVTGWYYQQFLKMQYALICEDEYYMVWDGDTIPCRPIRMFQEESGKPYFDLKTELHEGYFETLGRILPGMRKVIGRSFISEHMLFKTEYMREMIAEIEANGVGNEGMQKDPLQISENGAGRENYSGMKFWERILHAIPTERIQESDFSEFETYGTFCALRHMGDYVLREWHSFRLGGEFFDTETISERDFAWLGRDFDAISFEKGHSVREDHRNLFNNPKYQEKLSPRQMLESVQDLFNGGYVEAWN